MDGEKEENSVIKMVQAQKEVTQVVFRETKAGLHIAKTEANHQDSMSILAANGLRPLTYQEALSRAPELIKELEGKWFYLAGNVIAQNGIFTFNDKGELQPLKGNEKYDQKVSVYPGNQPLSLDVSSNYRDGRFVLDAKNYWPSVVASVVVGVKASSEGAVEPSQKSATVSNVAKALGLASVVRETLPQAIAALEISTKQEIVDVLKNVVRLASEIKE